MTALTPNFLEGTCRQALEFYRSYLPGELVLIGVQDTPVKEQMPVSQQDKVLNARFKRQQRGSFDIGLQGTVRGNRACLYLSGSDFQELKSLFENSTR